MRSPFINGVLGVVCAAAFSTAGSAEPPIKGDAGLKLTPSHTLGSPNFRHTYSITHVEPLADGERVLSSSRDGTTRLWNLADGKELRRFYQEGSDDDAWNVKLLPGDREFLTAGGNGKVTRWDLETGAKVKDYDCGGGDALRLAVLPGGKQFVSCQSNNTAKLWNLDDDEPVRVFKGHRESVYSATISPDGKTMVTGSEDGSVRAWAIATGKTLWVVKKVAKSDEDEEEIFEDVKDAVEAIEDAIEEVEIIEEIIEEVELEDPDPFAPAPPEEPPAVPKEKAPAKAPAGPGHTSDVYTVCYFPDGKHVASCSTDDTIALWNAATGEQQWKVKMPDSITVISPSPGGKRLAATCGNERIYVLSRADGETLLSMKLPGESHWPVSWSNDGKKLYSGDGMVHIWDAESGKQLFPPAENKHIQGDVEQLAISPDGKRLYARTEGDQIAVWDTAARKQVDLWTFDDSIDGIAMFPDGKELAVIVDDNTIKILNATSGNPRLSIPVGNDISSIKLADHGELIVVASSYDNKFFGFNSKDGKQRFQYPVNNKGGDESVDYNHIACAHDGERIYLFSETSIDVHRVSNGQRIRRIAHEAKDTFGHGILLSEDRALLGFGEPESQAQMIVYAPFIEGAGEKLTPEATAKFLACLGADEFAVREDATLQLIRGGDAVLAQLNKFTSADTEVKWRLSRVKSGIAEGMLPTRTAETKKLEEEANYSAAHPTLPLWATSERTNGKAAVRLGHFAGGKVTLGETATDGQSPGCVAFSPDGRWLYTGNRTGTISVYRLP